MMWFWWFAFVLDLLIPLIMILFGRIFWKHAPSKINRWYGHRTSRSMKNTDTWKFAHGHLGKQWWKMGWFLLLPSVLVLLPVYNASENTIAVVCLAVTVLQTVFFLYPVFRTEQALKCKFPDETVLR